MRVNKTLISAALATLVGTSAIAGGFAEPVMEEAPVVIVEPEETRSTYGILIPIVALVALVALAASSDDSDDE